MCQNIMTPDGEVDTIKELMDALPDGNIVWKYGGGEPEDTDVCLCSVDIPATLEGHGIPYSWNIKEWAFGYTSPMELTSWKHSEPL